MATEILAVASTVGVQSSELSHVEGTAITYVLSGPGTMRLLFKDSASALVDTGVRLSSAGQAAFKVDATGTFRWERVSGNCGVQKG